MRHTHKWIAAAAILTLHEQAPDSGSGSGAPNPTLDLDSAISEAEEAERAVVQNLAGFLPIVLDDDNPWGRILRGVTFRKQESKTAYPHYSGGKSRKLATAHFALCDPKTGVLVATLNGNVSAIMSPGGTIDIECKPLANGQTRTSALLPLGAESKAQYEEFLRAVGQVADDWLATQDVERPTSGSTAVRSKAVTNKAFENISVAERKAK